MDERSANEFEQAMRQFRADFARQLPGRVREAQDRLAACLEQPGDTRRLKDLHLVLHKLVGAAGTFGMPDLGEVAQDAETLVLDLLERPDRTAGDFGVLAQRVEAVAQAANSA